MNSESTILVQVWDLVRETIPQAKRNDIAMGLLKIYEDYVDPSDIEDIVDEDVYLARAYMTLYDKDEDESDDSHVDYDNEDYD